VCFFRSGFHVVMSAISYRLEPSLRARSELCHGLFHLKFRRNIVVVFGVFKGVSVFRFV
jgi:hypothetical protein